MRLLSWHCSILEMDADGVSSVDRGTCVINMGIISGVYVWYIIIYATPIKWLISQNDVISLTTYTISRDI